MPVLALRTNNHFMGILPSLSSVRRQSIGKVSGVFAEEGVRVALEKSDRDYNEDTIKKMSKTVGIMTNIGVKMAMSKTPLKYLAIVSTCIAVNSIVNEGIDSIIKDEKINNVAKKSAREIIYASTVMSRRQSLPPAFIRRSIGKTVKRTTRFCVRHAIANIEKNNNKDEGNKQGDVEDMELKIIKENKDSFSFVGNFLKKKEKLDDSVVILK